MLKYGRLYYTNREFDLLDLLETCNESINDIKINIMKQLAFLITSTLSLKNIT